MFDVTGRVACVTGASSGLGRAAASFLAKHGANVIGIARRADKLIEWRESCRDTCDGKVAIATADLSERGEVRKAAGAIAEPFGPPDILINAAGINTRQAAGEVTDAGWDRTIALNLSAPFFLAQAFVPAMKERGWGRIVNFASLQSRRAFPGGIAYGASKGGVEQLTRAMAEAWSADGITANALAPGFFPTELTGPVFSDRTLSEQLASQTCMGRNGELGDIEGPLLFFCSEASRYVTGQILFVDGGFTAK